ncbi:MAG: hypothetical protein M3680_21670, partial [Myxococcota bacterium]|nr:hypothetical protein [Myxococcota bacterium]
MLAVVDARGIDERDARDSQRRGPPRAEAVDQARGERRRRGGVPTRERLARRERQQARLLLRVQPLEQLRRHPAQRQRHQQAGRERTITRRDHRGESRDADPDGMREQRDEAGRLHPTSSLHGVDLRATVGCLTAGPGACTEHVFMSSAHLSMTPLAAGPDAGPDAARAADEDPVPADVRCVIELFTSQLAKVPFPDVDAASLRRQADELRADAKAVVRAREVLAAALAAA